MKLIYTSYFGNARNIDQQKYALIGIAGKSPEGWKGLEYKKLSPSWSIWKEWHNAMELAEKDPIKKKQACDHYVERFHKEILGNRNPNQVLEDISKLADGKVPVLLCYEKPGDFCHRHLVADWLQEYFGNLTVREYGVIPEICKGCMFSQVIDGEARCLKKSRIDMLFEECFRLMTYLWADSRNNIEIEVLPKRLDVLIRDMDNLKQLLVEQSKKKSLPPVVGRILGGCPYEVFNKGSPA